MDRDPFDMDALRVDPTNSRFQRGSGKTRKWHKGYVQFPWIWIDRLQSAKRVSTYRLALLVVYESWRTGSWTIVLSNILSGAVRLSAKSKWNALAELESLGLIKVERRPGRSPRATLLHLNGKPRNDRS
jgi:hypothetical protein